VSLLADARGPQSAPLDARIEPGLQARFDGEVLRFVLRALLALVAAEDTGAAGAPSKSSVVGLRAADRVLLRISSAGFSVPAAGRQAFEQQLIAIAGARLRLELGALQGLVEANGGALRLVDEGGATAIELSLPLESADAALHAVRAPG
jgi:hypothetical protein